jgi:hypothetical protein
MWTGAVTPSPETAWTKADPAVERVSPRNLSNWALEIYLVKGRLNPARCARDTPVQRRVG